MTCGLAERRNEEGSHEHTTALDLIGCAPPIPNQIPESFTVVTCISNLVEILARPDGLAFQDVVEDGIDNSLTHCSVSWV